MVTALLDVSWGSNQGLQHPFPPGLYPVERGLTILEKIVRAGERIFQRTFSLGLISCLGSEITLTVMLTEHYHTTGTFIKIIHLILTTAQWDRLDNPSFVNRDSEVSEIHKHLQVTGFEAGMNTDHPGSLHYSYGPCALCPVPNRILCSW